RLLPQEFQFNNKILSFKYVLLTNNNIKKIMLIVTDITLEKKLEERAKFEEERNKFIVKVALDKKSFIIFIKDLNNILNKIRKNIEQNNIDAEKIKYIFRLVHTIKGNASFYNLTRVVSVAHTMEDYLYNLTHNHKEQVDINKLNNYLDDLYIAFNESLDIISDFLSKDEIFKDEKIFEVPESTLNNIIDVLARLNLFEKEKEFIIEKLQDIKKISIKHILKRFIVNAQQLAEHLGKQIEPIEISNEDLHIDYYSLRSVIDTFVHLIRNAVDHGIETPDIRKKSGKPAKGKVSILLNEIVLENKKYFVFEISDDNKDIDLEKIRQKLIDNNFDRNAVYQMSDYDLYMHIFDDGISTKTEVSEISGRGVGLSAVKEQVEKLGGQIKVHSQKNQGTTIKILLPTI
ncbi:MAG TPA: ATP-binding protein, partial [bacterium]|nr:ATP-binding protein [bacterium]